MGPFSRRFAAVRPYLKSAREASNPVSMPWQESLRKYSVVPVVTRRVAADDTICGHHIPKDTYLACCLQAVHNSWRQPESWRPERFLPGGEYDGFKEDIRPFMVPFLASAGALIGPSCLQCPCRTACTLRCKCRCLKGVPRQGSGGGADCMRMPLQFVPFIQGPRNCLGQYFALLEARIVLGLLVKVTA